ncbi:hypothetical protein ILYODFUR_024069, partial [Ilyodon furcidens]
MWLPSVCLHPGPNQPQIMTASLKRPPFMDLLALQLTFDHKYDVRLRVRRYGQFPALPCHRTSSFLLLTGLQEHTPGSRLDVPAPSSQLRAYAISPGFDLDSSHLAQLSGLLPHHDSSLSPPPPPSTSLESGGLKKSFHPPAKRRRACPASTPPPATTSTGLSSAAVSALIPTAPQASTSSSTPAILQSFPTSFISSIDSLQGSTLSLTQHLQEFDFKSATSAPPPSPTLSDAQPTPRPQPLGFTLANARPGLSLGRPYTPMHAN